ncbi:DUF285 domain-containing protein [Niabella sp. CC-SYL272]|uniref:DUF285 domain-containing protein n=1 Tax=Niabella agricola TaxID=2891571 RepID=UPI001F249A81|nr:DUF285 domain-containing protein [Niabella agricola]MCF3110438.1 DUF285 domain-containing protein [Niabella agricola]
MKPMLHLFPGFRKSLLLLQAFLSLVINASAQDPGAFVAIFNTGPIALYEPAPRILIPATGSNFTINWKHLYGLNESGTAIGNDKTMLSLPDTGTYEVTITPGSGSFSTMTYGGDTTNAAKLLRITQWGTIAWSSMMNAFRDCRNLTITATDLPNLAGVTSMENAFSECTSLTTIPRIDQWDVSNVTNMQLMFYKAGAFDQNLGNWKLNSNVDMWGMLHVSGLSCENYSLTLKGWAEKNPLVNGRSLGAYGLVYGPVVKIYRDQLVNAQGWTISGDTYDAGCSVVLPVHFSAMQAFFKKGQLMVQWTTTAETNNDHFEIEVSSDGRLFTKIGELKTRAMEGNSTTSLDYSFAANAPGSGNGLPAAGLLGLIGLAVLGKRRLRVLGVVAGAGLIATLSCHKTNPVEAGDSTAVFVRLKQVDKDGRADYSKVVKAVAE